MLAKAVYCDMMGLSTADFAPIHALTACQSRKYQDKRKAYCILRYYMYPGHELVLLLINTLLQDLSSKNPLEVCLALDMVNVVIHQDMLSSLIDLVNGLLDHAVLDVKRKAIVVFQRMFSLDPSVMIPHLKKLKRLLGDANPHVMSAALSTFRVIAEIQPKLCASLRPAFLHILQQVSHKTLDETWMHHHVSGPSIQLDCIAILSQFYELEWEDVQPVIKVLMETMSLIDPNQEDYAGFGLMD